MRHARRKMAEIAGTDMPYEEFYQMIEERYEPYRKWALGEFKESGDEELWCKWLLPDYDPARIRQVCHELSFQYRQCKGRREVVDGGVEVIKGLHERGYKLGIISNLIGENEVPDWLEEDGLDSYFDTVILSSVCHMRKPCSEIYDLACQQIGVKPEGVRVRCGQHQARHCRGQEGRYRLQYYFPVSGEEASRGIYGGKPPGLCH